jgi:23S rRNA pseudouridine1911/1915/1917 synthase
MELNHVANRSGRLSSFLKEEMRMSTGLMNRLKWQELLFVNGVAVHTDHQVQPGDRITVKLAEPLPNYPAQQGQLTILYEDDHLLAVDKPAGMLVHPSRSQLEGTLANYVQGYYQSKGQICACHPVTRLDRDTYGVVLLAKNAHIHALMNQLHTDGKIEKVYHALVFGCPDTAEGTIDAPIDRRPLPSLLRFVSPEGKPSLTKFRVLECIGDLTKLALQPVTGRTHQLRVHCAHMGFPILGDPQYGSPQSLSRSGELGIESQLLCAKELTFPHPITEKSITICSRQDARIT